MAQVFTPGLADFLTRTLTERLAGILAVQDASGLADDFAVGLAIGFAAKLARVFAGTDTLTVIFAADFTERFARDHAPLSTVRDNLDAVLRSWNLFKESPQNPRVDFISGRRGNIRDISQSQTMNRQDMNRSLVSEVRIENTQGFRITERIRKAFVDLKTGFQFRLSNRFAVL